MIGSFFAFLALGFSSVGYYWAGWGALVSWMQTVTLVAAAVVTALAALAALSRKSKAAEGLLHRLLHDLTTA
jgi:hypothetical protein